MLFAIANFPSSGSHLHQAWEAHSARFAQQRIFCTVGNHLRQVWETLLPSAFSIRTLPPPESFASINFPLCATAQISTMGNHLRQVWETH
jgi:hypothetical protein